MVKNRGVARLRSLAFLLALPAALFAAQRELTPATQVKQVQALLNLRTLVTGLKLYGEDYDGVLPNVENLDSLKVVTLPYMKDKKLWKGVQEKSEIRFNFALRGAKVADIKEPSKTVVFYESKPWPDGQRAVAFFDGSGKVMGPIDWAEASHSLASKFERRAAPLPAKLGKSWKD